MLGWKYLLPEIAERNLELVAGGVLHASLTTSYPEGDELAGYEARFAVAADAALDAYRALVRDADFLPFFESVTPLAELSAMPLGSRPARRAGSARGGAEGPDPQLRHRDRAGPRGAFGHPAARR